MTKSFVVQKINLMESVGKLIAEYDEFSKTVSPQDWRLTGHHFTELRKMKEEIEGLHEITETERINAEKLGLL